MTCRWCGDDHPADRLCEKAERGMTRRSFCFLFGAGLAVLPVAVNFDASQVSSRVWMVPPDASMQIVSVLGASTVATFKAKDVNLRPGKMVCIEFQGQRVFDGRVERTVRTPDGLEVTAVGLAHDVEYDEALTPGYDHAMQLTLSRFNA